jgi:hypothetical protein
VSVEDWQDRAQAEIRGIKPVWAAKYGWKPKVQAREDAIDLYVSFARRPSGPPSTEPPQRFVLRLRYESGFETAGRREAFVNPGDPDEEGRQFWPTGVSGILPEHNPPAICLEGTWGFHSVLHRERDGRRATLNRLLMEIQECLNP